MRSVRTTLRSPFDFARDAQGERYAVPVRAERNPEGEIEACLGIMPCELLTGEHEFWRRILTPHAARSNAGARETASPPSQR
jgi:hypothetical protein